jgi:copper chaperone CopZ
MEPVRLKITGLGANADIAAVENALRTVPGVMNVSRDPKAPDQVRVEIAQSVRSDTLVQAVRDAGYTAVLIG